MASYASIVLSSLVLERRDKTPEQTLPSLVELLEGGDTLHRQHAALLLCRYATSYPELDFTIFRARLTRALSDQDYTTRSLIACALNPATFNAVETGRKATASTQAASQSNVP